MEEIIIMNIKRNYILWSAAWLMLFFLGACSDELAPAPQTGPETASLCFAVKGSQTRLGYDYETTTFDDGETVGCVIAEVDEDNNYTYLHNSVWKYRASDGMLIFQYYWENGYKIESDGVVGTDGIIMYEKDHRTGSTDEIDVSYLYSPYLAANPDKKLKFCFYYPYIYGDLLEDDVERVMNLYNSDNTIQFYQELYYPNIATNVGLTFKNQWGGDVVLENSNISTYLTTQLLVGTVIDDANNANNYYSIPGNKYGWREYPCFVNHTQGAVNGNMNDPRLHKSDFLWVASPEISATTQHTVNLTFLKKTATILVYSEVKLNDIYFTPNGEQTLLRGKQIDLATGELTDYTYSSAWDASVQQKNMYFNSDEHIVPCYRGTDTEDGSTEELHFYRLVLPAQADCRFKMHIDFTDNNTQVVRDINLSDDDKLTELKEGYMYSIRISKSGKTVIRINDWKDGGWAELE